MCGPIAMMLPVRNNLLKSDSNYHYHIGRLTAYGTIGLVFGLVGKGFFMAGIQQNLSIFIGIAMIAVILIPEKIFAKYNFLNLFSF
jgi:sulfite exporter TauE/SafE